MKEALLKLLTLLLELARIPTDEAEAVEKQKARINLHLDTIDTMHGDSELNDEDTREIISDLTQVLSTSAPSEDYAEIPENIDEFEEEQDEVGETPAQKKKSKATAIKAADEEEEAEEEEAEEKEEQEEEEAEEEEEEPAESPAQRKKRLDAEKKVKAKKK